MKEKIIIFGMLVGSAIGGTLSYQGGKIVGRNEYINSNGAPGKILVNMIGAPNPNPEPVTFTLKPETGRVRTVIGKMMCDSVEYPNQGIVRPCAVSDDGSLCVLSFIIESDVKINDKMDCAWLKRR